MPERGAEWWERTFKAGLALGTEYILKVDPDTRFNRPIASWPEFDCFGTVTCLGSDREHVQGGVQGFRRGAVERIVASGLCLNPRFREVAFWAWDPGMVREWTRTGYLSTDQTLRVLLLELGLTWGDWPEVVSWFGAAPQDWANYAISHAHKWQKLAAAPWMDGREMAVIEKLLTPDARVLEFGAGGSTLWLAARTREVHSVEHEEEWVNKLSIALPGNVTVHWRQPAFAHRRYEPAKPGQFTEYVGVPEELAMMFDVCLVDGRARVECALAAARWLKPGGWLFFHDWFPRQR